MELNRNQYFFAGVFLLLVGLQLRMVATYVLTPEATRLLASEPAAAAIDPAPANPYRLASTGGPNLLPGQRREVQPPDWLGWCLLSVGAVLVLHSLSMRKPE